MGRKNIVIAPCGNKSFLFREYWLNDKSERDFDICLLFYHDHINDSELYKDVDFFFHLRGFKYKMLYDLFIDHKPEWLEAYDYFYFLDDDIQICTHDINKMFYLTNAFDADISQASLSQDSFCSWPMFKQNSQCFLRYVGQIEVMAPLFSRNALKACIPSFIDSLSSWGMDSVWPKLLGYPENKLIVFDSIMMKHTLPVGGGELYNKLGVDPHVEWHAITNKYGAKLHNYKEYGRLKFLHVNNNFSYHILNSLREQYASFQRRIKDYNVGSRLKNKWNVFFKIKRTAAK